MWNDISTDRRQIGLFILLKMPTLANIGRLSFHPDAEVPDELKMMQRTEKSEYFQKKQIWMKRKMTKKE